MKKSWNRLIKYKYEKINNYCSTSATNCTKYMSLGRGNCITIEKQREGGGTKKLNRDKKWIKWWRRIRYNSIKLTKKKRSQR